MPKLLVTGSSGLIGSELVSFFSDLGWEVYGIDNNSRAVFFGPEGDTRWNQQRLQQKYPGFRHYECDVRDRARILELIEQIKPHACVHAAAQPSHDLAAQIPFEDFEVNAVGTLNLLEAFRRHAPESPFVFLSTNKVYGDAPNELPLIELETRWDYAREEHQSGIDENTRIDGTLHSLFGASKASADLLVQEYGRYFGMPTCCLRAGCLTGPMQAGVEQHGFLNFLGRAIVEERPYNIYGYKGKQVRDNIHAYDVARFIHLFVSSPTKAAVYNIGGGRPNSCSVLEAIALFELATDQKLQSNYVTNNRIGDHICYISNLTKIKTDFPQWAVTISLAEIIDRAVQHLFQRR